MPPAARRVMRGQNNERVALQTTAAYWRLYPKGQSGHFHIMTLRTAPASPKCELIIKTRRIPLWRLKTTVIPFEAPDVHAAWHVAYQTAKAWVSGHLPTTPTGKTNGRAWGIHVTASTKQATRDGNRD